MRTTKNSSDPDLGRRILDYLEQHPQAEDALEGIAQWWMLRQKVSEATEAVQLALKQLEAQGLVEEHRLPDGRILYRRFRKPSV